MIYNLISSLANLIQGMNSADPIVQEKAVLNTEKRLLLTEEDQEEDVQRNGKRQTWQDPEIIY